MVLPPEVVGTRRPVHRTLDQAVKGLAADAGTVALPPVLLVQGYLVMERVVDRYVGPRRLVNQARLIFSHIFQKLRNSDTSRRNFQETSEGSIL